jgi:hypothetical protein
MSALYLLLPGVVILVGWLYGLSFLGTSAAVAFLCTVAWCLTD